jgi:hypothetical protein
MSIRTIYNGPCDKDNKKVVSDTYTLQHQEYTIRPECVAYNARKRTHSLAGSSDTKPSKNHQRYLLPEAQRRSDFIPNISRKFRQQASKIARWSAREVRVLSPEIEQFGPTIFSILCQRERED